MTTERTNQQPTRPTLADFGAMLAENMQDYGTVLNPDGTIDETDTANNAIEALGEFADSIASIDFPGDGLRNIMLIINDYAISANNEETRRNAQKALNEIVNIIRVGQIINTYRQELYSISNASTRYAQAIARVLAAEYEQQKTQRGQ